MVTQRDATSTAVQHDDSRNDRERQNPVSP